MPTATPATPAFEVIVDDADAAGQHVKVAAEKRPGGRASSGEVRTELATVAPHRFAVLTDQQPPNGARTSTGDRSVDRRDAGPVPHLVQCGDVAEPDDRFGVRPESVSVDVCEQSEASATASQAQDGPDLRGADRGVEVCGALTVATGQVAEPVGGVVSDAP